MRAPAGRRATQTDEQGTGGKEKSRGIELGRERRKAGGRPAPITCRGAGRSGRAPSPSRPRSTTQRAATDLPEAPPPCSLRADLLRSC